MNIALEQTKEFVDGKLRRNYGDAFVRGNNGEFRPPQLGREAVANCPSDVHLSRLLSRLAQIEE